MKSNERFVDYVDRELATADEITAADLVKLWNGLVPGGAEQVQEARDLFLQSVRESLRESHPTALAFEPGAWRIKASNTVVKTVVISGLLGGILALSGFVGIAPIVIPAVIPLLFDVERITLTSKEEQVLAVLVLQPEVKANAANPKDLYEKLPEDIRHQINQLDFFDMVEKFFQTGNADKQGDGRYVITTPKFRVVVE